MRTNLMLLSCLVLAACNPPPKNIPHFIKQGFTFEELDRDRDGYENTKTFCEKFRDYDGLDCDDNDSNTYPGAAEVIDEKDNNCDGEIDEDLPPVRVCFVLYGTLPNDVPCDDETLAHIDEGSPYWWCEEHSHNDEPIDL